MSVDRLLLLTHVVFEGISSPLALTGHCLVIERLVAAHFEVKRLLINRFQVLLLRALEILPIRSSFGLASDRIVVRLKHMVNERDDLTANLSLTATIVIARKEAEKAASVLRFGISKSLPALPRSRWDSRALAHGPRLFIVVVEFRMDDAITEESRSQMNIAGAFEEFSTFRRNARGCLRRRRDKACISFLHAHVSGGASQRACAEDRRVPRLREPIAAQIHVEGMFGDGNVDEISRNIKACLTKIRKRNAWMLRNLPIEGLQGQFWDVKPFQVLVVILGSSPEQPN